MRRDLEMQQGFNQKLLSENADLRKDLDSLKRDLEAKKANDTLVSRQIRGLEEDNSRIASMYAQLTNQEMTVPVIQGASKQHELIKKDDKIKQDAKKGW